MYQLNRRERRQREMKEQKGKGKMRDREGSDY
jgi:hypothetical protein